MMEPVLQLLREKLGKYIYGENETTLEEAVGRLIAQEISTSKSLKLAQRRNTFEIEIRKSQKESTANLSILMFPMKL